MDINILRSIVTVLSFAAFIGIVMWALSKRNKKDFDEAAQLPFLDERGAMPKEDNTAAAQSSGALK